MKPDSKLAKCLEKGDFIVTAEYLPKAETTLSLNKEILKKLSADIQAVNVADNPYGIGMSSLAGSIALNESGVEPIYQLVTRDRNRIALGSDLLGASSLGIKNVLCLSGYHQTLTEYPGSANVYDIDSIQLIDMITQMNNENILPGGKKFEGDFGMLVGAAANPNLNPIELNIIRLVKKIEAGARFIQTQAVFNVQVFSKWIEMAQKEGVTEKTAIIAGVHPLESADEAEELCRTFTDYQIPDEIISRLKKAGDKKSQSREGLKICVEIIKEIKNISGLSGVHILSGGKENIVPELLSESGLAK